MVAAGLPAGGDPDLPAERLQLPRRLPQPPKFDPAASDAANYGAIGAIVGHEVSHFVDLLGMEWDAERCAGGGPRGIARSSTPPPSR